MAGDIEVTDNNIEDKSAIMTEDVAGKGGKKWEYSIKQEFSLVELLSKNQIKNSWK